MPRLPREQSKCREWEKERRNRLNEAFNALCKLLPCYDPAITISKVDILQNAASHIEDLQHKIKGLMTPENADSAKKVKEEEIKKLQERVRRLLSKNEQLCLLLREAKIAIPNGRAAVRKFKSHLYWSERIPPEKIKILQKNELNKENDAKKARKIVNKVKQCALANPGTPKHRKAILNRPSRKKGANKAAPPNNKCVIVLSQPNMTQPCYVITNAPTNNNNVLRNTPSTVITNSGLLTNPVVSSNVKSLKSASNSLPVLGPGTLILANGAVVPVLPQQTVLPMGTQLLNPLANKPSTVILLPNNNNHNKSVLQTQSVEVVSSGDKVVGSSGPPIKTLAKIRPKYCLTKTTQVNKVPIPALTSRYYASKDSVLNDTNEAKTLKTKIIGKNKIKENKGETTNNIAEKAEIGEKRKLSNGENLEIKKPKTTEDQSLLVENNTEGPEKKKAEEIVQKEIEPLEKEKSSDNKVVEKAPSVDDKVTLLQLVEPDAPEIIEECQNNDNDNDKASESITSKKPEEMKALELNMNHSELSNDIFASLQVPTGCQNPESTSPTAAFLLAFPLVSSLVKVAEVTEDDNTESQRGTPNLLQIGTMDATKPTQSESLTPSLMNLDNLSFFSKDICNSLYSSFDNNLGNSGTNNGNTPTTTSSGAVISGSKITESHRELGLQEVHKTPKFDFIHQESPRQPQQQPLQNLQQNQQQQPQQQQQQKNNAARSSDYGHFEAQILPPTTQMNYQLKPNKVHKSQDNGKVCSNYNITQNYQNNNFGVVCTSVIKSYPDPLYTNSNTYYGYPSDNNFNHNYYKNIAKNDNRSYNYSLNYENYSDYRKSDNQMNYYTNNCSKEKFNNAPSLPSSTSSVSKKANQSRAPINWMTTPDNRADYVLPQFSKEGDFGHNSIYASGNFVGNSTSSSTTTMTTAQSYFNANPAVYTPSNDLIPNQEARKAIDLPLVAPSTTYHHHNHNHHNNHGNVGNNQGKSDDDNQFSWSSPTKMQFLEPSHSFVSSTLPTLVGDLALGNPLTFGSSDQKKKADSNSNPARARVKNYENQANNFLSVSQLVEHNKSDVRAPVRRNSGAGRSSKKMQQISVPQQQQSNKQNRHKPENGNKVESGGNKHMKAPVYNTELFCPDKTNNNSRNVKNSSSSYSAEALIGHQMHQSTDTNNIVGKNNVINNNGRQNHNHNQQQHQNYNNKLSVPPFLTDNIIPYFPPVDLQQDNNYIHQNQNYQNFGHNFPTTFHQTNSYAPNTFIPAATTITSTYLSGNNFMHDMGVSNNNANNNNPTISNDYGDNLNLFPPAPSVIMKDKNNCGNNSTAANNLNSNNIIKNNPNNNNNRIIPGVPSSLSSSSSSGAVAHNPNSKKVKRKQQISGNNNEGVNNLPNLVDFSFLSMPGSINSPILPDDFHSHSGFLQPPTPQLYPCKNPFKQNDLASGGLLPPPLPPVPAPRMSAAPIQHPEISPSINNSAGTSLTNFNLSTIFPEINKGTLGEPYLEPRVIKEHPRSYGSSSQVAFNELKPSFSFSYINCTTTQYNNNHQ